MKNKYSVGDVVFVSKEFGEGLAWVTTEPTAALVVEIKDTVTYGPGYVLEINGVRLKACYWECDIDSKLYNDPDFLWMVWGDQ